jgi:hypothetical protein
MKAALERVAAGVYAFVAAPTMVLRREHGGHGKWQIMLMSTQRNGDQTLISNTVAAYSAWLQTTGLDDFKTGTLAEMREAIEQAVAWLPLPESGYKPVSLATAGHGYYHTADKAYYVARAEEGTGWEITHQPPHGFVSTGHKNLHSVRLDLVSLPRQRCPH